MDIRDKWLGIRQLKSEYKPQSYHRTNSTGEHIHHSNRAQEAANYLKTKQWGKADADEEEANQQTRQTHGRMKQETENQFDIGPITTEEIVAVLKKLKRRKAPGPDNIPMEILKELNAENLEELRNLMQQWWENEEIPEEELRARVVLIYKKGDTSKYENYRPISLLNSTYKVFAAIIQKRVADGIDEHLQQTQFGFRKKKSTADAIFLTRRVAEYGEKTKNKLMLLLLDWEKAFDRITRDKMHEAMESIGINPKLRNIIKALIHKYTIQNRN